MGGGGRDVTPLPWHADTWAGLIDRARQGRLPHALLFTGPQGLGKGHFARVFAQALLCDMPRADGTACDECRACMLYAAGTHPDITLVAPEEQGKAIRIDQIRALAQSLALTPQYGSRRVVILEPADRLNSAAANGLLKTLEEPASGALLILITARPAALLPTIRSRCQTISFAPPAREVAESWLEGRIKTDVAAAPILDLVGGRPLAALALIENDSLEQRMAMFEALRGIAAGRADPVATAAQWLKGGVELPLYWLYSWVTDLIRLRSVQGRSERAPGESDTPRLANSDIRDALQDLAKGVDLVRLFGFFDSLTESGRLTQGQVNAQLLLESLLLQWAEVTNDSNRSRQQNGAL